MMKGEGLKWTAKSATKTLIECDLNCNLNLYLCGHAFPKLVSYYTNAVNDRYTLQSLAHPITWLQNSDQFAITT